MDVSGEEMPMSQEENGDKFGEDGEGRGSQVVVSSVPVNSGLGEGELIVN